MLKASGDTNVTVTAVYAKNTETYTVTIVNQLEDDTVISSYSSDPMVVGEAVAITAAQTRTYNGGTVYFDHWEVNGVEYASTTITLRPNTEGNYTAVAVYKTEVVEQEANVSILGAEAETLNGVNKTAVTMTWSLPEGCTLVKAGFEISQTPDLSKISTAVTKLTIPSGAYTVHVKTAGKEDLTIYFRAFVTYEDANGEQHTIYTDPWAGYVWNELNNNP